MGRTAIDAAQQLGGSPHPPQARLGPPYRRRPHPFSPARWGLDPDECSSMYAECLLAHVAAEEPPEAGGADADADAGRADHDLIALHDLELEGFAWDEDEQGT